MRQIDDSTTAGLRRIAEADAGTTQRLAELDREWDVDRVLEAEAATMGLVGLGLGLLGKPALLALPALVGGSVFYQAQTGRYPLMPLFRRLGVRTSREIARERYALKALRGDFSSSGETESEERFKFAAEATSSPSLPPPAPDEQEPTAQFGSQLPPTTLRVEMHTDSALNEEIGARTEAELLRLERAGRAAIEERLTELEEEWDIERVLQTNASALVLAGLALGTGFDRRFLALPIAVFAFFAQHAFQGWCPPIPLLRRLGIRTMREIERERYAIKVLRGDFEGLPRPDAPTSERVRAILKAVDA
ncbi:MULTISPECIES: hypothetical protein [unclassified Variovorax]|uniref:hypothetical protein n=1 Tax=unclassified Variovorax TaxID=663243 RepID=UPI0018D80471|nr:MULTISPECIES: hypothetical protein [unclassified Variovorax]